MGFEFRQSSDRFQFRRTNKPQNEAKFEKTVTLPTAIPSRTRVAPRITSPPLPPVTKDVYDMATVGGLEPPNVLGRIAWPCSRTHSTAGS